ncbi:MAG: hypothetical protein WC821_05490 [archaeon]|jgi:hypothetical protein
MEKNLIRSLFFLIILITLSTIVNATDITSLSATFDTNIAIESQCTENKDSNLLITDTTNNVELLKTTYPCIITSKTTTHAFSGLKDRSVLEINLTISQPCDVCTKSFYLPISFKKETNFIPDNSLVGLVLVLGLVIGIISIKKK